MVGFLISATIDKYLELEIWRRACGERERERERGIHEWKEGDHPVFIVFYHSKQCHSV